jgi:hypothetical protein
VKTLGEFGILPKVKESLKNNYLKQGFLCIRYDEILTKRNDFIIKSLNHFINENVALESKEQKKKDIYLLVPVKQLS